jgi:hypothetical protein
MIIPVINPGLPHEARAAMAAIDLGIWVAFLAQHLARLYVTPDRLKFIIRNPLNLLLAVIPVLRPLRLLRAITLIRASRLARVGAAVGVAVREGRVRLTAAVRYWRWVSRDLDSGYSRDGTRCGASCAKGEHQQLRRRRVVGRINDHDRRIWRPPRPLPGNRCRAPPLAAAASARPPVSSGAKTQP